MTRVLLRQRRRILVFVLCLLAAGTIRLGPDPRVLLLVLPGLFLPALVLRQWPDYRRAIESSGLGIVALSAMPLPPISLVPLAPLAGYLAWLALHGAWSDRTPLRVSLVSARAARISAPVEDVWDQLIPGAAPPDRHWTGTLVDIMADPDDPTALRLRRRTVSGLAEEMELTFLDHVADRSCRYVLTRQTDGCPDVAVHTFSVDPMGDAQTAVESVLGQREMLPRVALGRFLDDAMGDEWDGPGIRSTCRRSWHFHSRDRSPLPAVPNPA